MYRLTPRSTLFPYPTLFRSTATDAANNIGSAHISVITMPPPTLSLTLPAPGSFINTSVVTLSGGRAEENTSALHSTMSTVSHRIRALQNFNLGAAEGVHTLH